MTTLSATVPACTEKELRKWVEKRQTAYLWGQKHLITPRLCGTAFGNGGALIGLAPIMFRPNHFVVRVDTGWNLSNWASECELLIDHTDEIYDAIEEEYRYWPWRRAYGLRGKSARVNFDDGAAWWEIEWPTLSAPAQP